MKLANLECRLAVLEERTKPRMISVAGRFRHLVCDMAATGDVEFTPAMKEAPTRDNHWGNEARTLSSPSGLRLWKRMQSRD
jgi:hypothetical protein